MLRIHNTLYSMGIITETLLLWKHSGLLVMIFVFCLGGVYFILVLFIHALANILSDLFQFTLRVANDRLLCRKHVYPSWRLIKGDNSGHVFL